LYTFKNTRFYLVLLSSFAGGACAPASAPSWASGESELYDTATAPDPTARGSLAVASTEYRLPAAVDADVLGDRPTEIWAVVHRPSSLTGIHPVVIFLHGNHGTCRFGDADDSSVAYTTTGSCPSGAVVVPNHRGYDYAGTMLASWGYVVVSINANRGITGGQGTPDDFGLNLARGRLVLKHLALLSAWNAQPGTTPQSLGADLAGHLDLDQVGLVGHSRGGEGVRAAYNQYLDPGSPWPARIGPVGFQGIFEIGPVDGQTGRVLDAPGVAWNVLLPSCDGDVSDWEGMHPFDRMLVAGATGAPRSMLAVWGANHNFYNTEWRQSDENGCEAARIFSPDDEGSDSQRTTGLYALLAFFRGRVGADAAPSFASLYDPRFALPSGLTAITPIERAYEGPEAGHDVIVVDDFGAPTGTSSSGAPNLAKGVSVVHETVQEHIASYRAARVTWSAGTAGSPPLFQPNAAQEGSSVDVSALATLDVRVARLSDEPVAAALDFEIALVHADGSLSQPVALSSYVPLVGPTPGALGSHELLETVRIPLGDFQDAALPTVRGVRFLFDRSPSGSIYLGNVRFTREPIAARVAAPTVGRAVAPDGPPREPRRIVGGNALERVAPAVDGSGEVEVQVFSGATFPVVDALPVLRVGTVTSQLSSYGDDGDLRRLRFRVPAAALAGVRDGEPMVVQYGDGKPSVVWEIGPFHRN
jgi:hypothetical protein